MYKNTFKINHDESCHLKPGCLKIIKKVFEIINIWVKLFDFISWITHDMFLPFFFKDSYYGYSFNIQFHITLFINSVILCYVFYMYLL